MPTTKPKPSEATPKSTMKDLFSSKKFVVTLIGLLVAMLPTLGVTVTPEQTEQIIYLIMAYLGAQGITDAGKSYAQVKANGG